MHTRLLSLLITVAILGGLAAPTASRAQQPNLGSVNISGFYMAADDSDRYVDFAGFSVRLGFYIAPTTELIGEFSLADGLDLPDHLDYSMNFGLMVGVTQYLPLNDFSSLYIRGKAGVIHNTWEYDRWFADPAYGCRNCTKEERDSYFTCSIGGGVSVMLSHNIAMEAGYAYQAIKDKRDADDPDPGSRWPGYHIVHVGIDILF